MISVLKKKIVIIGSGFSSLSAACYLSNYGHEIHLFEKNKTFGGRARRLIKDKFVFDMGPSWYWMPDIINSFFNDFGKSTSDFFRLKKLNPAYQVYFGKKDSLLIEDSLGKICETFESIEPGSSKKLEDFIKNAEENYNIAIKDYVYKPGISPLELVSLKTLKKIKYFISNIKTDVEKKFKNKKLRQILQFPVLFLGAKPSKTPAFYNFMNYADFGLGTWHPEKGFYSLVEAMINLAKSLGVNLYNNSNINKILVENGKVTGVNINSKNIYCDIVLSGADYYHSESLLELKYRGYNESYWKSRTFAPSALLFYIGINKKLKNVSHHTVFFDESFDSHAEAIYDNPKWPKNPLLYANFPSISDSKMAPKGSEVCTILIPLAPGLKDSQKIRKQYYDLVIERLEKLTDQKIKKNILFYESFCLNDFTKDYNSYKGNAYGLANTLFQTAFLKPKLKSKKVKNLFFTGQLTVPGPGVPPSLISGKIVSKLINESIPLN